MPGFEIIDKEEKATINKIFVLKKSWPIDIDTRDDLLSANDLIKKNRK